MFSTKMKNPVIRFGNYQLVSQKMGDGIKQRYLFYNFTLDRAISTNFGYSELAWRPNLDSILCVSGWGHWISILKTIT